MLGICWLQVALTWFQDASRSLYVGSFWPQNAQNDPPNSPIGGGAFGSHPDRFRGLVYRTLSKQQFLSSFGSNFVEMWTIFGVLGRVCPKRSQDTLKIAAGWPTGPNLGPSWLQVGSSWTHVGPKLAPQVGSNLLQLGPMLTSCWRHFRVPGRPWAKHDRNLNRFKP